MKVTLIKKMLVITAALVFIAGCNADTFDGNRKTSGEYPDAVRVKVEAQVRMDRKFDSDLCTKTTFVGRGYDTIGVWNSIGTSKYHPLRFNIGDKIYSYAESGVYMVYALTSGDFVSRDSSRVTPEILYRRGDTWVTSYYKGKSIGEHVGRRTSSEIEFKNGIPAYQDGTFESYHVCMAQAYPEAEMEFFNMQAYLRFETKGANKDAKLMGDTLKMIKVSSLGYEQMAGNLQIGNKGGWLCYVKEGSDNDSDIITVIPQEGWFKTSDTPMASGINGYKSYFVAVPARRYSAGIRLSLYTTSMTEMTGYVDIPAVTIYGSDILNCHDLLLYTVILVQKIEFSYDGDEIKTTTNPTGMDMKVMKGHIGKITPIITPSDATDKALEWESDDEDVVKINQDGSFEAVGTGSCTITARAKDENHVEKSFSITVNDEGGVVPSDYTPTTYDWD